MTATTLAKLATLLPLLALSCSRAPSDLLQGYIEGEFVYVASPLAGALNQLKVQRGAQVKAGDVLFSLEDTPERAARDEAERRLIQARASLADLKKGSRPTEIAAIEAQLKQAEAALEFSEKELIRQESLFRSPGAATQQEVDRARSTRDQDNQRMAQLKAQLETAQLGSRADQVSAGEANVRALEAALARADWDLSQKQQKSSAGGLVYDTLFRAGEWVPAGRPVVALLPPGSVKLRTYVPQTRVAALRPGDPVQVFVDGVAGSIPAKVSFVAPRAEYTPPVIYNRENRAKFVFLVEAVFDDAAAAARLHPGQPVDVKFVASNR